MKALMRPFAALLVLITTTGCVSTQVRSYTDTQHASYTITNTAIAVGTPDVGLTDAIETSLTEALTEQGVKVVRWVDILPPTREYTTEEVVAAFGKVGAKSLLSVEVVDGGQSSQVVGANSFSNSNAWAYGNQAYASGNSTTYAIVAHNRATIMKSELFDLHAKNAVWTAQIETKAGGSFFMHDSATADNAVESIITELAEKGHLKIAQ